MIGAADAQRHDVVFDVSGTSPTRPPVDGRSGLLRRIRRNRLRFERVQTLEPHRREGEMLAHPPTINESQQAGMVQALDALLNVVAEYFFPDAFTERSPDRVEISPSAQSKDATEQEVVAKSGAAVLN
jgi:hypothetical protein